MVFNGFIVLTGRKQRKTIRSADRTDFFGRRAMKCAGAARR